ncbi:MAG: RNA polymerase sporulation sigma factor SigE [Clostridia bacterium]|nr:RNA polymerase sporulation sigma factor SigE [Clostridia bacterium]
MNTPFQLYSLARQKLTDLVTSLTSQELYYIGGPEPLPAPLTAEEERVLLDHLPADDGSIRRTLIERNLRLVVFIARKFDNTGVMLEDLISIGTIGLIKAVNTFDPTKKIKLATYASRCIENEVLMFLRRHSRTRQEVSIDEPLKTDWDGNELLLSDVLGTEPDTVSRGIEDDAEKAVLFEALSRLAPREKQIMSLRFGLGGREEMTQKEVADVMGISQSYISRLEKRILQRLHGEMLRAGAC